MFLFEVFVVLNFLQKVATISANSDEHIGKLIAGAMAKVGREGVISVKDGKTLEDEIEVIEGMKFDQGYISRYFATDNKTQKCEMENPYILLVDKKISNIHELLPILEQISQARAKLVIIAENVDGEALATLILNKLRGLNVVAVKAPGFGDNRKANLQDLAVLTGGQVVSEEVGLKLEEVTLQMLGRAKNVEISQDDTLVLDGAGESSAIAERCDSIKSAIEATKSEYEKEKLQERLAKLSGGVAILKVKGKIRVVMFISDCSTRLVEVRRLKLERRRIAFKTLFTPLALPLRAVLFLEEVPRCCTPARSWSMSR